MLLTTRQGLPIITSLIFLLFSLPFVGIGGYFGYTNYQLAAHGIKAEGRVTELVASYSSRHGRSYAPVFDFVTPDQQSHSVQSRIYSNPARFAIGERVNVLYPANQPDNAQINSFSQFWLLPLVFLFFGGIALLIGAGMLVTIIRTSITTRWLKQNGQRVTTTIQSVQKNTRFRINGQSPFQIYSTWMNPLTQETITMKSDYIWLDPTPAVQGRTTIDALVDPNNPKRHWLDLDSLNFLQ